MNYVNDVNVQTVNSELIWETFFFTATVCVNRAYMEWVWLTGSGCGFLEWVWLKRTGWGLHGSGCGLAKSEL